ncbi:MAG: excinuclease ABC subunit UvrA [Prevotellaceae bacterium]|jgi:excinuclease ABC subunit A|nr:excinuclease ABC subunit UvrA [Prevotellaceae bacterium]
MSSQETEIQVTGAREHNLKNINVTIPRNKLTVITGLSGSGKSSLAFDTIYAEGQRRYMETLSAYARQFLGTMERPNVEQITGLSPVISIEQKTTNKNPRSTVGTITEIYDFLRLLFARASIAYSKETGEEMVRYTDDQIAKLIIDKFNGQKSAILAPIVRGRKGYYKELFEQLRKKGYLYVRIDNQIRELKPQMKVDRYKTHFIEVVVDRLIPSKNDIKRLRDSLVTAMHQGKGTVVMLNMETGEQRYYSRTLMCPTTGISYNEPAPHTFSFNSPQGACPNCNGLGTVAEIDIEKIIPNPKASIKKGGFEPLGAYRNNTIFTQLEAIAKKYGFSTSAPMEAIPDEAMAVILYGSDEPLRISGTQTGGASYMMNFEGIVNIINNRNEDDAADFSKKWADRFIKYITCPVCNGTRLKEESLHFRIADKNIAELAAMDIVSLFEWITSLEPKLNKRQQTIGHEVLKEIRTRLSFLLDVGLSYLSLSRSTKSLSGGESQRIRLATQIGSKLVNVLYILDEPSIGLHQRDNQKLIRSLKQLRDEENSVIVVEHDEDMIRSADYVVDIGPLAGINGGEIVAVGTPEEIIQTSSLTAQYLNGKKQIAIPKERRKGSGKTLKIYGATGNNLKNIDVEFPLGTFICVTGVSGSGKSTLINETLQPILSQHFYRSYQDPLPYRKVEGIKNVDKVIEVDQSPIGRTPRSNPATYTNVFVDIRKLFEATPEAKIRGYNAGRFSFNVKGGRCEECRGAGVQTIEMNFLPDVYVTCKTCNGKRYNRETLEVKYKGKSINDVLNMTIDQACDFFESIPTIYNKIRTLRDVGLSYVTLGQPSTTLSGGESQRVKLATELSKRDTGNTFYILDEPTTGLHFEDVRILLGVLDKLVDRGNTVLVVEHNLDVIKVADYIIDLGKEGGEGGGEILATGNPEEIIKSKKSYTAKYLKEALKLSLIPNSEVKP